MEVVFTTFAGQYRLLNKYTCLTFLDSIIYVLKYRVN
ncbi:hypothetical protein NIASO_07340 [Niabella soli DSM 19437]|uniref:Uncharacterized protein n=1 Tax=Niabella soli DSM 19437 TaxID=929713 RepID=W0F7V0_9BACT|nr:hypothetical protein NIASO_07340 [Niabella soli DSM 19437]